MNRLIFSETALRPRCKVVLLLLATFFGSCAFADAKTKPNWWWRTPGAIAPALNGIAFGNDRFVAVGRCAIVLSEDGKDWHSPIPLGDFNLRSVTFGGDKWVAVGDAGKILTSETGTNWTPAISPVVDNLVRVAYGASNFVAAAKHGTILSSTNGSDWVSTYSDTAADFRDIAYGNGRFVVAGSPLLSGNGLTWESLTNVYGQTVAFANDRFIVQGWGATFTSPDGQDWTQGDAERDFSVTRSLGNLFMGLTGRRADSWISEDGLEWSQAKTTCSLCPSMGYIIDAAKGNGVSVAIGSQAVKMDEALVAISTNNVDWIVRPHANNGYWDTIIYGNEGFVTVGTGLRHKSPDGGSTWQNEPAELLVGADEFIYQETSGALGNGIFVRVDYRGFLTSTNGKEWRLQSFPDGKAFFAVKYLAGGFVAVGDHGQVAFSKDALHWEYRDSGVEMSLHSIAYGNGYYVAVGSSLTNGTVIVSKDLNEWEIPISAPSGTHTILTSVAFGDNRFVAVGAHLFTSQNGKEWYSYPDYFSGFSAGVYAVAFGGGRFVAVGSEASVLQSEAALPGPHRLSLDSSSFRFESGRASFLFDDQSSVALEASIDLLSWLTLTNSTGPLLQDPEPPGARRFYRLRALP